jgi:hypothetical protein
MPRKFDYPAIKLVALAAAMLIVGALIHIATAVGKVRLQHCS